MNQAVRSWNRWQQRPKYGGPDAVSIDEEKVVLTAETKTRSEEKQMSRADQKVGINEGAVTSMALHGAQDRVESLFRETGRTLKRLGTSVGHKIVPFKRVPRHKGGMPNIHDLMRWLDNIQSTKQFADDVLFLKRLHLTIRNRVSGELIAEVEG